MKNSEAISFIKENYTRIAELNYQAQYITNDKAKKVLDSAKKYKKSISHGGYFLITYFDEEKEELVDIKIKSKLTLQNILILLICDMHCVTLQQTQKICKMVLS